MGKKVKKEDETRGKETFDPLPIESKAPATVVLLLSSPEEDVLIKACEAIYKFAEKGDENKAALLGLEALEPLCQLISHSNKMVRRSAFMVLGIMAANNDVRDALKNTDVIPSIIDKLSPEEDTVVHEFATMCLASLSVDFVCKVQIFDNKGLPPLIQLLSSSDPDVKKNSLEVIFNLVQDYPCRVVVHEMGGIPPLLDLLKSDFPVIQQLTLKTLENITTDKDTRTTFREEQGFEKLMDILNNKDFVDLHHAALQVVSNCVSDSECLYLIHQGGGLSKLMKFVLTPTVPEIQSNAVECIARVAESSENYKLLHDQEVERALVELLSVADASVKMAACHAVAAMSLQQASKESFRGLDVIPALVQLLSSECLLLREAVIHALSNLTHTNQLNATIVHEAGGHEILVQMLHDSVPETVAHAAATLGNMAAQEVLRCSILSHAVMQNLVEPLTSTHTQVLINTTQCLAALACDADARAELRSAGGLYPLVSLLHSSHKEVCLSACLAVSVCASDEPTSVEMCKFGALETLQEINQSVSRRSRFSQLAMINLLNSNLSVKYSLTGRLASTDIISDGFYDAGQARAGQRILTLEEFSKQPVNQQRPIIAVNTATHRITADPPEERLESLAETDTSPANSKASHSHRKLSKVKKKEDDKQKDEAQPAPATEQPWKMADDVSLQVLVKEAAECVLQLKDEQQQYSALARLVSEAMGGAVEMEKLHEFLWELHLSELKFKLQSNVVPVGAISKGIYSHRALLFKVRPTSLRPGAILSSSSDLSFILLISSFAFECLADSMGVSCTLVRGEYHRAWNEVLVFSHDGSLQPCRYIVDLMHQPGNLLKANSPAATQYQTI
ncbi:hypothetical protein LDENG_00031130 [Lucifuga dentata]|nr:hypothetical protein LDENG_00031130 [Lucifuga dentata]